MDNRENLYIAGFQGLRLVACLMVFLLHYGCCNQRFDCAATWAVSCFFMVSGFLRGRKYMIGSASSTAEVRSIREWLVDGCCFAWNKIRALYPLHIVLFIMCIPFQEIVSTVTEKGMRSVLFWISAFGLDVSLTKSLIPKHYFTFNQVSWFLSTYAMLCILTPWMLHKASCFIKMDRRNVMVARGMSLLAAFVAWGWIYSFSCWKFGWNIEYCSYVCPLGRLSEYVGGIILGMMSHAFYDWFFNSGHKVWQVVAVYFAVPCCVAVIGGFAYGHFLPEWMMRSCVWIIPNLLLCLLLGAGRSHDPISVALSFWPIAALGGLSNYFYLLHNVIIRYCSRYGVLGRIGIDNNVGLILIIALTFLLSWLWKCLMLKIWCVKDFRRQ